MRNGRFFVHLGDTGQETLSDTVFDEETLYVVTWVVNDDDVVYRLPPQELRTVPHAVTAKRAIEFEVKESLTVDSITPRGPTLEIAGGVSTTGPSTLRGPINVTGDLIVSGITRLNSRRGNLGTKPSDGNWHTVVSGLNGVHVYELVVRASKGSCHGIGPRVLQSTLQRGDP